MDNLDEAIADCNEAIRLDPKALQPYMSRSDPCLFRGDLHFIMGNLEKALEDFNEGIRLDPKCARAHQLRARVLVKKNEYNKALEGFNKAIELDPTAAEPFAYRAAEYLRRRDYDKAIADYNEIIRNVPHQIKWYERRGNAKIKNGDIDGAIANWTEAFEHLPESAAACESRAVLYLQKRDFDKAIDDFDEAVRLQPDNRLRGSYACLARISARRIGDYRSNCRYMLDRAGDTEDPSSAHTLAWTCVFTANAVDDYSTPVALARKAVKSDGESPNFARTLGTILFRVGKTDEAVGWLTQAELLSKNRRFISPSFNWLFLAMALHAQKNHGEARMWLDKAVAGTNKVFQENDEKKGKPLARNRRLTLELLRKEAEMLIGAKK